MGEVEFVQKALVTAVDEALQEQVQAVEELRLTTPGGRFQVRWDEDVTLCILSTSLTASAATAFFHPDMYWRFLAIRRGNTGKPVTIMVQ